MKKVLLSILLACVLFASVFALAGCGNKNSDKSDKAPIIGSWNHSGYVYTFNEDKTGSYEAFGRIMEFTYEDDGNQVRILYKGNTVPGTYEYKVDGDKLIIKDSFGSDVIYKKK